VAQRTKTRTHYWNRFRKPSPLPLRSYSTRRGNNNAGTRLNRLAVQPYLTATICWRTTAAASADGMLFCSQSRTVLAFNSVSTATSARELLHFSHIGQAITQMSFVPAVVNVFDTMTTSVFSALSDSCEPAPMARSTSTGSTFARNLSVRPLAYVRASTSVFSASCTNSGPKSKYHYFNHAEQAA
jgi:hypothetical protein